MSVTLADDATQPATPPTTPAAPAVPATRPARPARAARPALPEKHADEILAMLVDPDPDTCALGRRYNLGRQITHDIVGHDADLQQRAVAVLAKVSTGEVRDSGGKRIVPDEPGWCRWNLRPVVLKVLLASKQYDLITQMAAMAVVDGRDSAGIDASQAALVEALLAAGKYDQALPAAKTFYNCALLQNTARATDLLAEALLNGPGVKDPDIVARFKSEQVAGAQAPLSYSASDPPSIPAQTVLKSIVIDPAPFQAALAQVSAGPKTYDSLTQQGNLLLLQDKGADAVPIFQASVNVTNDPKLLLAAIANVARAMRARDGCVGPANAYIVAMQQSAQPTGN